MLAMTCPQCGAAVPLSLASPDHVRCPSCEYQGAPSPELAAQLAEAQTALDGCEAAGRQLGRVQRASVQWGLYSEIGFVLMVLVCTAPLGLMALKALWDALFTQGVMAATSWIMVLALLPVLLILFGVAALGWLLLRRSRRKLEQACCAVPPSKAGEPAGCHVCGGPLQSRGTQKVVRCGYCGADNLVAPAVLQRAGAAHETVLEGYDREVKQRAYQVSGTLSKVTIAFLILLFVSPVLCGAPTLIVTTMVWATGMATWALVETNKPPSEEQRYGIAEVPEGRCVGWIDPYEEEMTVEFDPPLPSGTVVTVDDLDEIWAVSDLIGQQVVVRETGETGPVVKALRGLHILENGTTEEGGAQIHIDLGDENLSVRSYSVCLVVDE